MRKIVFIMMFGLLFTCLVNAQAQSQSTSKSAYADAKNKAKDGNSKSPKVIELERLKLQLDETNNSIEEIDRKLDALQAERNALQEQRYKTKQDITNLVFGITPKSDSPTKEASASQSATPSAPSIYSAPSSNSRSTPGTDVQVKGYYRKDGTYVQPHTRSAPRKKP